jgi:hydrogenase maturation protease
MIAVIGCGNPTRSDDGAAVVGALAARPACRDPRVRLLDAGTDGLAVMFAARGCDALIVVDACRSGAVPGAVFEVPGAELAQPHRPALTLHDFRWDHALFAGRSMLGDAFPSDATVFLVEAATTDYGVGLSPPVAVAVEVVAARIERRLRARLDLEAAQ